MEDNRMLEEINKNMNEMKEQFKISNKKLERNIIASVLCAAVLLYFLLK
jgi:hypothetical protein